jgi:phosphoribosylformimino-5-aminoimidazole carboxamide ribotide isomerase
MTGGFEIIPAIDLRGGRAVRLVQGDFARETVHAEDPVGAARGFKEAGARRIHLVDLDGARAGAPQHLEVVREIVGLGVEVQVGGGLRDLASLASVLDEIGARWAILGTAAVRDPELVASAARRWPGRILAGIDARAGRVAVEGWLETLEMTPEALARTLTERGIAGIVTTDIGRDGTGRGPNLEATLALARATPIPVYASGGVQGWDDLVTLRAASPPIAGVVVGRALYVGGVDLARALSELTQVTGVK